MVDVMKVEAFCSFAMMICCISFEVRKNDLLRYLLDFWEKIGVFWSENGVVGSIIGVTVLFLWWKLFNSCGAEGGIGGL